ncbi:NAD(P)-dependent dehydrogenase, short-chain alcohol dehydrogenase family [Micromonospora pallida]|uniref:NAD(P)-dependent dehydrogenase, short-chain alcohol dehydrogenase family n=1 Tax=Micromonospora pallida TaxID=145854 RepID=A0A1C6RUC0_9ACTN|nr:SDR family oxidoreductase [Micromonospora pallida]SCL20813.1 NAD(P)-dependent dehydrogenase, short-chain alcohol dehydrogenase family [Micromonospora pallida]
MTGLSRGLRGRTAMVTGGAQGIGAAVAERLCAEGCRVVILDISADAGRDTIARLHRQGHSAHLAVGNVTDTAAVDAAFAGVPASWATPTLLVNLAAGFVFKGVEATAADWHAALDPTIIGLSHVTRAFVAGLPERNADAAIVNMASISAHIAQEGYLTYNTGKAAVLGFTRCMAQDLAPRGIRVNSVSPGTVWNASNERFHREVLGLDRAAAEAAPEHGGRFLLRRFADPAEVAAPIAFLLSSEASFITGTDLPIDGGYLAV